MNSTREFDPIFRPLSFSGRVRKAINLSHKLRHHAHHRVAKLSRGNKIAISAAAAASFFLLSVAAPLVYSAGSLAYGLWEKDSALKSFRASHFTDSAAAADSATSSFNLAGTEFAEFEFTLTLLGHPGLFQHITTYLTDESQLSSSLAKSSRSAEMLSDLSTRLSSNASSVTLSGYQAVTAINIASQNLQSSQGQLNAAYLKQRDSHNSLAQLLNSKIKLDLPLH